MTLQILGGVTWIIGKQLWMEGGQMLRERTTTTRERNPAGARKRSECDTSEQIRAKVTDQCSCVYETPLTMDARKISHQQN
ncbi:hypothetical protein Pmani_023925 [Petrolisthes manimaculis]|uniref:Uncharacterized protein n=1 Tax=Petrolisthes manimaculis TaxID=1843537 RepID=A0AAE1U0L5_9EUCA|nr:hypothetical protein Pmani_023925 [Petrolisthes manimaculis]